MKAGSGEAVCALCVGAGVAPWQCHQSHAPHYMAHKTSLAHSHVHLNGFENQFIETCSVAGVIS